mgnify:FL=1
MESLFQFTNPILTDLEIHLNEGFNGKNNEEVKMKTAMSSKVFQKENINEATVSLTVEIGEINDNTPFYIKSKEEADFKWDDSINDIMLDRLLNQNAPSLLLSYLRPIIAQITNASKYGVYNIPFINFTKSD